MMIFSKVRVKISNTIDIDKSRKEFIKKNFMSVNSLLRFQRKVGKNQISDDMIFPRMNFFNPQTKEILKRDLTRFLAQNKPIKPRPFVKIEQPKVNKRKFFQDYQSNSLKKKIESIALMKKRRSSQENSANSSQSSIKYPSLNNSIGFHKKISHKTSKKVSFKDSNISSILPSLSTTKLLS